MLFAALSCWSLFGALSDANRRCFLCVLDNRRNGAILLRIRNLALKGTPNGRDQNPRAEVRDEAQIYRHDNASRKSRDDPRQQGGRKRTKDRQRRQKRDTLLRS